MGMNNKDGLSVRPGTEGLSMKKWWLAAPLVVALLLIATPSDAGGRHHRHHHWRGGPRVFVGFGVGPVWGYPYPYWYHPPYYVYSPYVYAPPTVVVQQPPVYVEQQTAAPAPPVGSAPSAQQFWYYCQPSGAYYPSVPTCSEPWIKVPPRPQ